MKGFPSTGEGRGRITQTRRRLVSQITFVEATTSNFLFSHHASSRGRGDFVISAAGEEEEETKNKFSKRRERRYGGNEWRADAHSIARDLCLLLPTCLFALCFQKVPRKARNLTSRKCPKILNTSSKRFFYTLGENGTKVVLRTNW